MDKTDILAQLMETLRQRREADPQDSYVASLYRDGLPAIVAKISEEAQETVEAADGDAPHLVHEVADLWFHTLVLLALRDLDAQDVLEELQRRFGQSGLEEKAHRKKPPAVQ